MLVAWLILIGVVAVVATAVSLRRRSHDDVHSVEGYHRQLHTLEVLRTHTDVEAGAAYPESAFKVSTHATVRLTEPGKPVVPPVPPPPVTDPDRPVTFDDAGSVVSTPVTAPGSDWREDKAMQGINRRPRRLAAPAAAVAAVSLVIVLLLVFGSHSVPPHHPPASATGSRGHATSHTSTTVRSHTTTTVKSKVKTKAGTHHNTTTTVPVVSLPHAGSPHNAVYAVGPGSYTLAMSATTSQCWVDATEAGSGTILFTGILNPGQTQSVSATGAVSLVVGAPNSFAANINGTAVSFPFGYLAPFTMQFLPAGNQTT